MQTYIYHTLHTTSHYWKYTSDVWLRYSQLLEYDLRGVCLDDKGDAIRKQLSGDKLVCILCEMKSIPEYILRCIGT